MTRSRDSRKTAGQTAALAAGPAPHADRGGCVAVAGPSAKSARVLAKECQLQHLPEQHTSFPKASDPKGKTREASQPHVWRYQAKSHPSMRPARLCCCQTPIKPRWHGESRRSNSASLRRRPLRKGFDYDPNEPLRLVKPRKSEVDR